jgi:hypothetical protein
MHSTGCKKRVDHCHPLCGIMTASHKGADRLAMIYSLIGTCKLNDVNPYEWLKDVLDKLDNLPINKIHELLCIFRSMLVLRHIW